MSLECLFGFHKFNLQQNLRHYTIFICSGCNQTFKVSYNYYNTILSNPEKCPLHRMIFIIQDENYMRIRALCIDSGYTMLFHKKYNIKL